MRKIERISIGTADGERLERLVREVASEQLDPVAQADELADDELILSAAPAETRRKIPKCCKDRPAGSRQHSASAVIVSG